MFLKFFLSNLGWLVGDRMKLRKLIYCCDELVINSLMFFGFSDFICFCCFILFCLGVVL